ncbi:tripartite motif-containing protein 16-like [Boleophthalmus pectinirostris]|uniref:tripartite motif-containing protein 16-like n=1 Tax=Boleophthalmus pectinirostris TaxID=150288 RepID=UPI00242A5F1F|nr:tripartite motif-containing protein 16-like [Boleophthalmus pectinirostris]
MADKVLDMETLTCPICLDLLKEPVTIPCGHSFCKSCIQNYWDQQVNFRCPECRKKYRSRPVLGKNIILSALVEQLKKIASPADQCAGPQDVACDVCSGERKLKAIKSCLQCVVSYCEVHLQPHHTVAMLQRHQLVTPSHKLQENICQGHNKVMELFCRTDQQLLCFLCSVDHHKGHDVVSCAAERARRQAEQDAKKDLVLQNLQDKDADLQMLQQEAQDISSSAQRAVQRSGDMFREIALLLDKRRSEVEQQILTQEKIQLSRVQELQDQLQQEATELRKSLSELEELSNNSDHNQFILHCLSLPTERTGTRVQTGHKHFFEEVTRAVSELKDKLQLSVSEFQLPNPLQYISAEPDIFTDIDVEALLSEPDDSLPPSAPSTRKQFLKYAKDITLDLKTNWLSVSEGNRTVTHKRKPQHEVEEYVVSQVLSREELRGRSYWEVLVRGTPTIAISYKKRTSGSGVFGYDNKSWSLEIDRKKCFFWFNNTRCRVSGLRSSRVGVYLDQSAGVLSFYSVSSDTMTLIHRVQATFTQPLYAGVGLQYGDSAHFVQLKKL